jgi:hypothetical protein
MLEDVPLDWIAAPIADSSCVAVTDGLYMKELHPYLNSAAFVLECSKGRGRLMGSFVEQTPNAGSYRGELLGLMAIHLILRSMNEVSQTCGDRYIFTPAVREL